MPISNIALQNRINVLAKQIAYLKSQICCSIDGDASSVSGVTSAPFLKTDVDGLIVAGTKATHVDPTTGTTTQIINALIAAGLMT